MLYLPMPLVVPVEFMHRKARQEKKKKVEKYTTSVSEHIKFNKINESKELCLI